MSTLLFRSVPCAVAVRCPCAMPPQASAQRRPASQTQHKAGQAANVPEISQNNIIQVPKGSKFSPRHQQAGQAAGGARRRAEEEAAAVKRLVEVSRREQATSSGPGDFDAGTVAQDVRALLRAGMKEVEVERLILAGGGGPHLDPVSGGAAIRKLLRRGMKAGQLLDMMLASPRVLAADDLDGAVDALWQLCDSNKEMLHLLCAAPQLLHCPRELLQENVDRWRRQLKYTSDTFREAVYNALRRHGGVLGLTLGTRWRHRLSAQVESPKDWPLQVDLRDVLPFEVLINEEKDGCPREFRLSEYGTWRTHIVSLIRTLSQPEEEMLKTRATMLHGLSTLGSRLGDASLAELVARFNISMLGEGKVPHNLDAMCSFVGSMEAAKRVLRWHPALLDRDFSTACMQARVAFWGQRMGQLQAGAQPSAESVMLACGPLLKSRLRRVAPRVLWVQERHGKQVRWSKYRHFNTAGYGAEACCFCKHFKLRYDKEDVEEYAAFRKAWLASEEGRAWCRKA